MSIEKGIYLLEEKKFGGFEFLAVSEYEIRIVKNDVSIVFTFDW